MNRNRCPDRALPAWLPRSLPLLLLVCVLGSGACGGGDGGGDELLTLTVTASVDGYLLKDLDYAPGDATYLTVGALPGIVVGNEESQSWIRKGYVSFDISSLPAGATVVSASLQLWLQSNTGDPYATLCVFGDCGAKVAHVDIGGTLTEADWDAERKVLGELAADDTATGWKHADVTGGVKADRDLLQGTSDFEVAFPLSALSMLGSSGTSTVTFEDLESSLGTGNKPLLVITYTMP